jgi:hypothetical protein
MITCSNKQHHERSSDKGFRHTGVWHRTRRPHKDCTVQVCNGHNAGKELQVLLRPCLLQYHMYLELHICVKLRRFPKFNTWLQICNVFSTLRDNSGSLVSDNHWTSDDEVSNPSLCKVVDIRATNTNGRHAKKYLCKFE